MSRLEIEDLTVSVEGRKVLRELSFSADEGELICVLGPNGAGKSTLFKSILGLLSPDSGNILLDGVSSGKLKRRELASKIAYIPQSHSLSFSYTVMDTVLMGAAHMLSPLQHPEQQHRMLAAEALRSMGIEALADRDFTRLSGGEQQLVLIARALAQRAPILLMDEPTSALDYGHQLMLMETTRELTDRGYTILLSTHDPQQALLYADRVLALREGSVDACGKPGEIITADFMRRLYGAEVAVVQSEFGAAMIPLHGQRENCSGNRTKI